MSYNSKDELVLGRQLKVQRLSIPFVITAHATASAVVISRDEPAILFLKTEGVDEITAAADGSPTFTAPDDSDGIFNILVVLNESVAKVMNARVVGRTAAKDFLIVVPCAEEQANSEALLTAEANLIKSLPCPTFC